MVKTSKIRSFYFDGIYIWMLCALMNESARYKGNAIATANEKISLEFSYAWLESEKPGKLAKAKLAAT